MYVDINYAYLIFSHFFILLLREPHMERLRMYLWLYDQEWPLVAIWSAKDLNWSWWDAKQAAQPLYYLSSPKITNL